jgi:hypothetical protein
MNTLILSLLPLFLFAGPLVAQTRDSTRPPADRAGQLPEGWTARPDGDGKTSDIKFVTMEPGYHLTLGPATILYRKEDRVDGPFHTLATFHQMKRWEHPEGYGLFVGGRNLEGPNQVYTYFLVRDDGKFNIKVRDGEKLAQYTDGWQASSAIKKADAKGATSNLLEIDAKSDPKRVSFKVNGKEVHWMPAHMMFSMKGIVGLRVNHNLDIHIEGFQVHK